MIRKRPEKAARSTGARSSRKTKRSSQPQEAESAAEGAEEGAEEALEVVEAVAVAGKAEGEAGGEAGGEIAVAVTEEGETAPSAAEDGEQDVPAKGRKGRKAPKASLDPAAIERLALRLEALLFASGQALGTRRLSKALDVTAEDVRKGIEVLESRWAERESALELVEASGGWRLMTRALYHDDVAQLAAKTKLEKLSPAALETLAVVAYRQPIGRADIEAVRGVQCGPLLRVLLDRDLIRITGRSSEPGHPLLYGTSKRFLDHFGLASLKNLPDVKDLLNVS